MYFQELITELEDLKKTTPANWLFGDDRRTNIADELRRYKANVSGNKVLIYFFDTFNWKIKF